MTTAKVNKGKKCEVERCYNDLLVCLRRDADPRDAAKWVVEGLCQRFDVPLIQGELDPIEHLAALGNAHLGAFLVAGQSPVRRRRAMRMALAWVEELRDQVLYWETEGRRRDAALEREWFQ